MFYRQMNVTALLHTLFGKLRYIVVAFQAQLQRKIQNFNESHSAAKINSAMKIDEKFRDLLGAPKEICDVPKTFQVKRQGGKGGMFSPLVIKKYHDLLTT